MTIEKVFPYSHGRIKGYDEGFYEALMEVKEGNLQTKDIEKIIKKYEEDIT